MLDRKSSQVCSHLMLCARMLRHSAQPSGPHSLPSKPPEQNQSVKSLGEGGVPFKAGSQGHLDRQSPGIPAASPRGACCRTRFLFAEVHLHTRVSEPRRRCGQTAAGEHFISLPTGLQVAQINSTTYPSQPQRQAEALRQKRTRLEDPLCGARDGLLRSIRC